MARSPLYDLYGSAGGDAGYEPLEFDPATGEFRRRRELLADLLPEEEKKTMLRKLSEVGSSGIAGLGWLLDTPGSVVRGTLSGGPMKGLSALWDTSEDRVSGRDLARQYGLAGSEDTWTNFAGGIGTELLLDPLSYLTLGASQILGRGATTASGRLLRAAGGLDNVDELARLAEVAKATAAGAPDAAQIAKGLPRQFARQNTPASVLEMLDDTVKLPNYADDTLNMVETQRSRVANRFKELADREGLDYQELLNQPLARMNSWGSPWSHKDAFDLFGEKVGDWAAKFGDETAEGIRQAPYLGRAVRTAAKVFDPRVMDFITAKGQDQARRLFGMQESATKEGRERLARYMLEAQNDITQAGVVQSSPEYARYFLNAINDTPEFNDFLPADHPIRALFAEGTANDRLVKEARRIFEEAPERAAELGLKFTKWQSKAGSKFYPRQQTRFDIAEVPVWPEGSPVPNPYQKNAWQRGFQRAATRDTSSLSRADYMDMFGGTDIANQMSLDKGFEGVLDTTAPTHRVTLSTGATADVIREADGSMSLIGSGGELTPLDPALVRSSTPLPPSMTGARKALAEVLRATPDAEVQKVIRDWVGEINPATGERMRYSTLDDDIYKWVDETDEETGKFLYDVPSLPKEHPLVQRMAALTEELRAVPDGWAGEADKLRLSGEMNSLREQIQAEARATYKNSLYVQLSDLMRQLDPQHARKGVPLFGNNPWNELQNYVSKRAGTEVNGEFLLNLMREHQIGQSPEFVPGGQVYGIDEVARLLKFDPAIFRKAYAKKFGIGLDDLPPGNPAMDGAERAAEILAHQEQALNKVAFPTSLIDDWAGHVKRGATSPGGDDLLKPYDDYTSSFKTLALLWPARYFRDLYSGAFAAAAKGRFNPSSWLAGKQIREGDYERLGKILADAPGYRHLENPAARVKKFLVESAGAGMSTSTATDELARGAGGALLDEPYPGASRPEWGSLKRKVYNPDRTWKQAFVGEGFGRDTWNPFLGDFSPFATRGSGGNRNPLMDLGDRAAETTDSMNRYGTYLEGILRGDSPSQAAAMANLTQVNYKPTAFTSFERDVLKRLFPFYSYTKGITPFIADEVLNNPTGLTGLSVRTINRATEPNEDFFTPEYLRQSASIPLPSGFPGLGLPEGSPLQRFVTNIDLPYESAVNLITPGVGNTTWDKFSSGAQKTASNILGQSNPLLKGILEMVSNRQFYSGRQLSDLYSMLEQTLGTPGRTIEQIALNAPGGSRAIGVIRQLTDDRLTPAERATKLAVNTLLGIKLQDVDQERTKQLAARNTLNELLSSTAGVRTYENITVPDEALLKMPPEQRRMYLLYKVIQSEASKKARLREKAEAALNPAAAMGLRMP
jgi:hypothetical protein